MTRGGFVLKLLLVNPGGFIAIGNERNFLVQKKERNKTMNISTEILQQRINELDFEIELILNSVDKFSNYDATTTEVDKLLDEKEDLIYQLIYITSGEYQKEDAEYAEIKIASRY